MACVYRMPDNKCEKDSCEDYEAYCGFDDTSDCVWYKQSNGDLIRAKSDEELAKTISGDQIYPWCTKPCEYDNCYDCVLAWLKQEAEA